MRLAALDLGSNTFHLLVVDVQPDGQLLVVERAKRVPRIGEAIFRTGEIPGATLASALDALAALMPVVARCRPEAVLAVATSAVREARNGAVLLAEARARFGLDVRLISGQEEARLAYAGARPRIGGGRAALFDLGGGSLEVVVGEHDRVLHAQSAPLGVLRAVAASPLSDPAAPGELRALTAWTRPRVEALVAPARSLGLGQVVLCAGTARALRSVARALGRSPDAGRGADHVSRDTLRWLIAHLAALPLRERRGVPGLAADRADIIVHGAAILEAVLAVAGADEALVCRTALREGLILDHVARRGHTGARPSETPRAPLPGTTWRRAEA